QTNDLAWRQRATLRVVHGDCQKKPVPLQGRPRNFSYKCDVTRIDCRGVACDARAWRRELAYLPLRQVLTGFASEAPTFGLRNFSYK
ncbi:MAG: hypothetical protein LBK99_17570, partial [Opitutaceae bacterium]|nr:hypothetical protein [Opitutaceae bacterium]